jgi:hypothetical protein
MDVEDAGSDVEMLNSDHHPSAVFSDVSLKTYKTDMLSY